MSGWYVRRGGWFLQETNGWTHRCVATLFDTKEQALAAAEPFGEHAEVQSADGPECFDWDQKAPGWSDEPMPWPVVTT